MHTFRYVTSVEGYTCKIQDISDKQVEIIFESFQEEEGDDLIRFVER